MKNCKIIIDLLPNYIEKLTSRETNKYIQKHLKKCNKCKHILELMDSDIGEDEIEKLNMEYEASYFIKVGRIYSILKFIIFTILLILIFLSVTQIIILIQLLEK